MKPENETFAGCCFLGFFGHILHINENILQLPLVIVPNQKHLKFVKKNYHWGKKNQSRWNIGAWIVIATGCT